MVCNVSKLLITKPGILCYLLKGAKGKYDDTNWWYHMTMGDIQLNEIKCIKNRVIHHMLSENNNMTLLLIKTWTTPHEKNVMPCRKCLVSFHILASGSGHARFTVSMNCKIRKEIPGLQDWRMLELSLIWGFRVLLKKVPKSNWKHCLIITRDSSDSVTQTTSTFYFNVNCTPVKCLLVMRYLLTKADDSPPSRVSHPS